MKTTYLEPTQNPVLCLDCGKPMDAYSQTAADFVVPQSYAPSSQQCEQCEATHNVQRIKSGQIRFVLID